MFPRPLFQHQPGVLHNFLERGVCGVRFQLVTPTHPMEMTCWFWTTCSVWLFRFMRFMLPKYGDMLRWDIVRPSLTRQGLDSRFNTRPSYRKPNQKVHPGVGARSSFQWAKIVGLNSPKLGRILWEEHGTTPKIPEIKGGKWLSLVHTSCLSAFHGSI